ncbi:MAG TPA: hypothetical protein VH186_13350 [Chloroflexia bacterium]|nr:hypothetical protein [Chloroflexia bacterium]
MRFIANLDASKEDLKIILQILRDNMDYAEANDIFRVYMEDENKPGGVIIEEHYDENETLIARRKH